MFQVAYNTETVDENNNDYYLINCVFLPSQKRMYNTKLSKQTGYRLGGEFYELLNSCPALKNITVSRLRLGQSSNTNIILRAIDTGGLDGRIKLYISNEPFYGKDTDRTMASININVSLSNEQQIALCEKFNSILEAYREKYNSVFLTNYRNSTKLYARKRISFDDAYKLIKYCGFSLNLF
jgi:hypothetical protein